MQTKAILSLIKFSTIAFVFSLIFFQCSSSRKSVNNNSVLNADDVKNMLDNKEFIFVADRVFPLRGRSHTLTSEYDVIVKKDSLISYLPYFGRAYQAPVNPAEGGIKFTSLNFSYEVNSNKNHGWDVYVKPKDFRDVQQLSFNIFENGRATLSVTSTYKDPISYSGYIQKIKNKE